MIQTSRCSYETYNSGKYKLYKMFSENRIRGNKDLNWERVLICYYFPSIN